MKLLKYLKGFKIAILSLVVVLGVRVVAELALPTYTSNIVDTGNKVVLKMLYLAKLVKNH